MINEAFVLDDGPNVAAQFSPATLGGSALLPPARLLQLVQSEGDEAGL